MLNGIEMMNSYSATLELLLYYLCTVMFYTRVLHAEYKKYMLLISVALILPMTVMDRFGDIYFYMDAIVFYFLGSILLCRMTIKKSSVWVLIKCYLFLNFTNILAGFFFITFLGMKSVLAIELFTNTLTAVIITVICCTGLRNRLRLILEHTSRMVINLMLVLLITLTMLGTILVADQVLPKNPSIKSFAKYLFLGLIILTIIIAICIMVYSMTNRLIKSRAESYEKQIASQYEYYTELSASYLELRRFRHDHRNMQIGLRKLLAENRTCEALEMLDKMDESTGASVKFDTGSGVVDALLSIKQKAAEKTNTLIGFEGSVPARSIEPVELCIIFGNSLDNAIEACAKLSPDKRKNIKISCSHMGGIAHIRITNPVSKRVVMHGGLPATTKKDPGAHGLGLYSIQRVIKKYDGGIRCECDDELFSLTIELFLYEEDDKTTNKRKKAVSGE